MKNCNHSILTTFIKIINENVKVIQFILFFDYQTISFVKSEYVLTLLAFY